MIAVVCSCAVSLCCRERTNERRSIVTVHIASTLPSLSPLRYHTLSYYRSKHSHYHQSVHIARGMKLAASDSNRRTIDWSSERGATVDAAACRRVEHA